MVHLSDLLSSLPRHERSRSRSKGRDRSKSDSKHEPLSPKARPRSASGVSPARPLSFASRRDDTIISITTTAVPPSEVEAGSNPSEIICLEVKCDTIQHKEVVQFTNGSVEEQIEEQNDIHYLVETYAKEDPRIRQRASKTKNSIKTNTQGLIEQLRLNTILSSLAAKLTSLSKTIYVDVEDDLFDGSDNLHNIPWETLENPALWPEGSPYDTNKSKALGIEICVRRGGAKGRLAMANKFRSQPDVVVPPVTVGKHATFNILIAAARNLSAKNDDDTQAQLVHPLFGAINKIPATIHVNVEVCRPGTWEALRKHISAKPKGFYHVVHLDMPAQADATLSFTSPKEFNDLEGVSATRVAEYLADYEVPAVFLHCHNETTPRVNQKKLLGAFVKARLTVIATQFDLVRGYLFKFVDSFYNSLLVYNRQGVAFAAHVARRELYQGSYTRTGRYCMQIPVTAEYLGIIAYDNAKIDELDMTAFIYDNADGIPARFGHDWADIVFPNRDNDILRLEKWALQKSNIIWMTGQRHIGKTEMMKYLIWWWRLTRFVEINVFAELGTSQATFRGLIVDMVKFFIERDEIKKFSDKDLLEFSESTKPFRAQKIYKELLKLFRTRRLYLFFDDVDQWKPVTPYRTEENAAVWKREKEALLEFLDDLKGGQTIVIAVCPYNNRSIAEKYGDVYVLDRLSDQALSAYYYSLDWSTVFSGLGHFEDRNIAQLAMENEFCDFHDSIVRMNEGIPGVNDYFIYTRPFGGEQRCRDIHVLLHSSTPGTTGPYTMEASAVTFMTNIYNRIMLERTDIEDKEPSSNQNICRLLYSLCQFQGWMPSSLDMYLIFLSYYGLFTDEWKLPFDSVHDHSKDDWEPRRPETWSEALKALPESPLKKNFDLLIKALLEADYLMPVPENTDYYKINPALTMVLRKIVFASDGVLTEPIVPLAIRPAADEFYIHRWTSDDVVIDLQLEKSTFVLMMWSVISKGNNLRAIHLAASAPILRHLAVDLSPTDQRLIHHVLSTVASWFADLVEREVYAQPEVSEEIFFQFWVRAYAATSNAVLFHGQRGLEPVIYYNYVKMMRKMESFGAQYDEERWEAYDMHRYLVTLTAGEANVQDMLDSGYLVDESRQQEERAPPPAYEPPQEIRTTLEGGMIPSQPMPSPGTPATPATPATPSIQGQA